jgi:hypothetical protein
VRPDEPAASSNDGEICEISGSHGGEYEVRSLVGCTAVFSIGCRPTLQRCVLPPIENTAVHPRRLSQNFRRCNFLTGQVLSCQGVCYT